MFNRNLTIVDDNNYGIMTRRGNRSSTQLKIVHRPDAASMSAGLAGTRVTGSVLINSKDMCLKCFSGLETW